MTKEQEFRKQTEEAKFEAFSLMCKKVTDLEKENAELKKKIGIYQKGMYDEIEKRDRKLNKAKEIIKNLLILKNDHYGNTKMEWRVEVTEQAEQFLKEIEK